MYINVSRTTVEYRNIYKRSNNNGGIPCPHKPDATIHALYIGLHVPINHTQLSACSYKAWLALIYYSYYSTYVVSLGGATYWSPKSELYI